MREVWDKGVDGVCLILVRRDVIMELQPSRVGLDVRCDSKRVKSSASIVRMILEHCVCTASLFTPGCTLASRSIYKLFSDSPSPLLSLAACSSSALFSHSDNHSAVLTGLSLIITQPTVRLCIALHHSTKHTYESRTDSYLERVSSYLVSDNS